MSEPLELERSAMNGPPVTLGTAGHVDHGKTALVRVLTGAETDRLPEERRRGISIELGYAPLTLASGRRISVVDVPGHERFVRTMVAGASGVDAFLMTIAADDGVMPQTREHAAVLAGLDVTQGVVAVTRADLADPAAARAQARELLPATEVVAVSALTGAGLGDLRAALERLVASVDGRALMPGPARLHVDRVFTIRGAGTVATGTLWAGEVARGDELVLLPAGRRVRVRAVQVHDEPRERASAGQRVAVNLANVDRREVARGDVLVGRDGDLEASHVLDAALDLPTRSRPAEHGERVQVHHGTREAPARMIELGGRFWQLRLQAPLVATRGDRLIVRRIAPPDTLGGGVVLDPHAPRHGPSRALTARLTGLLAGGPEADPQLAPRRHAPGARVPVSGSLTASAAPGGVPVPVSVPVSGSLTASAAPGVPVPAAAMSPEALALERRLLEAWFEPPLDTALPPEELAALAALREAGRAVRVGRTLHYHPSALAEIERRLMAVIERDGAATLGRLRDELGTSRKFAQALLEHFDSVRLTRRGHDDSRVLRRR